MKVDFERFHATDGVELQGWHSNAAIPSTDLATLHVHGFAGDGHTNKFLDALRLHMQKSATHSSPSTLAAAAS